jgi:hypothetical protein
MGAMPFLARLAHKMLLVQGIPSMLSGNAASQSLPAA